jgi:ABC-type transport system involved in cytochrome c biogenesis ATPase subunit
VFCFHNDANLLLLLTWWQVHELEGVLEGDSLTLAPTFARLSAGQQRRVGLALFFALFGLARRHTHHGADYLMLDEVFDTLDAEGQSAVQVSFRAFID